MPKTVAAGGALDAIVATDGSNVALAILPGTSHNTLYEDISATPVTPSVVGGPVGTIKDNITGRTLLAPSAARRATLATEASAQKLVFPSVDGGCYSTTAAIDGSAEQVLTVFYVGHFCESLAVVYEHGTNPNVQIGGSALWAANASPRSIELPKLKSNGAAQELRWTPQPDGLLQLTALHDFSQTVTANSALLWRNGVSIPHSSIERVSNFGGFARNDNIYVGSRANSDYFYKNDMSAMVFRFGPLDTATREAWEDALVETYF